MKNYYIHQPLNTEIISIGGHYLFIKEVRVFLNSVYPENIFGHMHVSSSEIGNFGQAQENQGIVRRHTHSMSHKKSCGLTQRSPQMASSGWKLNNREIIYVTGCAVADTSCCGAGGCAFANVPGYILCWKEYTDSNGLFVSAVEYVTDMKIQKAIKEIIRKNEGITQVNFYE